MKERSYTVRVQTHPETWGNENFLARRISASKLLPDTTHVSYPVYSRTFCAAPLPSGPARSFAGTCTVSRYSAYLFSSYVIQRVTCESISRVMSHPSTREIV